MMAHDKRVTEFKRLVNINDLELLIPQVIDITANKSERELLSERCLVLSVNSFTARITIIKSSSHEFEAKGSLKAEVSQICVVTLEMMINQISTQFVQKYSTHDLNISDDLVIGPDDEQPPDPIVSDDIDLGELASEYLLLSIDPYPRSIESDDKKYKLQTNTKEDGPFSNLKDLLDSN